MVRSGPNEVREGRGGGTPREERKSTLKEKVNISKAKEIYANVHFAFDKKSRK